MTVTQPLQTQEVGEPDREMPFPGTVGSRVWDVIVIGGGNAALVAAISAREQGASVLIVERSPIGFRGGNSRHTRNTRCAHGEETAAYSYTTGVYPEEELLQDLLEVGGGPSDNPDFARMVDRAMAAVLSGDTKPDTVFGNCAGLVSMARSVSCRVRLSVTSMQSCEGLRRVRFSTAEMWSTRSSATNWRAERLTAICSPTPVASRQSAAWVQACSST